MCVRVAWEPAENTPASTLPLVVQEAGGGGVGGVVGRGICILKKLQGDSEATSWLRNHLLKKDFNQNL